MARFVQKRQVELSMESENHSNRDEDRTAAATGRKLCRLCGIGFGILCILQAALNISLRIFLYNHTQQKEEVYKVVTEPDELRNLPDRLFKEGWVYFRPSFYYVSPTMKSWDESRHDCRSRGADLMIIDSPEEQAFSRGISKKAWIGLTDRAEEGTWRWVDGTPLNTSYWFDGEPNNNHLGQEEHCAEVNFRATENSWNDWMCEGENYWICEIKVAP